MATEQFQATLNSKLAKTIQEVKAECLKDETLLVNYEID